jgi:4'-phosphopantetheinyl transferase EntD
MSLVSRLLVPGLFGAEIEDRGQPLCLLPQEEALVAQAAEKRRRDFTLGRTCARAALAGMGHEGIAIGKGENGAPLWPAGIVGSITHTNGYAAALAGSAQQFAGLGLDAERVGGVTENLWPRLFDEEERGSLAGIDAAGKAVAATLFFSAKEAAFKAWGGLGALAFRDIHVAQEGQAFTACRPGHPVLRGRYVVEGDLMLAAAGF